MKMKRTFIYYFLLILYLEFVFHFLCFSKIDFFQFLLILFSGLIFSVIFTFVTSLFKKEKLNYIVFTFIFFILILFFGSELIYFKLYDSFFTFSAIAFIGVLKDGSDKIISSIFDNIFGILLFITPIIFILFNKNKKFSHINLNESILFVVLFLLSFGYKNFIIYHVNLDDSYSFKQLVKDVNMPMLNVENFGLFSSSLLSLKRSVLGFEEKKISNEDIFDNKNTSLSDASDIKYNVTDIDFDSLISNEKNESIKEIHKFVFNSIPTEQNKFTGIFKDKNLIFILAESFDEIAIDKDLTPTLYKMKNEGIKFNNYFSPKYPASTADGQYMEEWGLFPIIGDVYSLIDMVYNYNPYLLPRLFKNLNYTTSFYHNYIGGYNYRKSYVSSLPYDHKKFCRDGLNLRCESFHGSDLEMMKQSVNDYIKSDKFFTYYISLSGHGVYDSSNFIAQKNINAVSGYDYPYNLKYYLAANLEFEYSMKYLLDSLKENNKLDDTVIIISSDHSPYYLEPYQMNYRSKFDKNDKFEKNRGSFIIYNSGVNLKYEVNKYAMNVDVLPTILNLFGFKYDSRLIIGKDILSNNNDGLVVLPDRSWINEFGSYDTKFHVFKPFSDNIDSKYIVKTTQEVNNRYQISVNMQYNDYYKYVLKE